MKNISLLLTGLILNYTVNPILADAAEPAQTNFQDPATPIAEGILNFHQDLMFIVIVIGVFVAYMLYRAVTLFARERHPKSIRFTHGTTLEIIWTIIPAVILVVISVPSFALLYSVDEIIDPSLTVKVVGHQWYWSYEYSDYANDNGDSINFDSYMIPTTDLEVGQLRLLEVDNQVIVPVNTHIRLILTAADVLHSWAVPSFGIKLDCLPGRLNQASLFVKREGTFYGQCSEICGINHAFMPIVVKAVALDSYSTWIAEKLADL